MKLKLFLTLAAVTISMSVNAQKLSEDQRDEAMINLFARSTLVDGKFAITREPITYYEYWAATGDKAHSPNTSVTNAAVVSDGKQANMVKCINDYFGKKVVSLATNDQIRLAHQRIGLHRELGENSLAGRGFFLVIDAEQYQVFKKEYDEEMQKRYDEIMEERHHKKKEEHRRRSH